MKVERAVGTRRGASDAPNRVHRIKDKSTLPERLHRSLDVLCNLFLCHASVFLIDCKGTAFSPKTVRQGHIYYIKEKKNRKKEAKSQR